MIETRYGKCGYWDWDHTWIDQECPSPPEPRKNLTQYISEVEPKVQEILSQWNSIGGYRPQIVDASNISGYKVDGKGVRVPEAQIEWSKAGKVALIGRMHSGKTTMSQVFEKNGYKHIAFAGELKEIAVSLLNSIEIQVRQHIGGKWKQVTREEVDRDKALLRTLHQFIGAYGRRRFGDDVWIRVLEDIMTPIPNLVVIDDARYLNEAQWLKSKGFTLIKIERPEKARRQSVIDSFTGKHGRPPKKRELKDILNHESETEVDSLPYDILVLNNGSAANMREVAQKITGMSALKPRW